jgi:multisubunit Na+/H+ antiporter MnhC subunit
MFRIFVFITYTFGWVYVFYVGYIDTIMKPFSLLQSEVNIIIIIRSVGSRRPPMIMIDAITMVEPLKALLTSTGIVIEHNYIIFVSIYMYIYTDN